MIHHLTQRGFLVQRFFELRNGGIHMSVVVAMERRRFFTGHGLECARGFHKAEFL